MLEYSTYFELTTRLMAGVNRSGVIALDLFLCLYQDLWQTQISSNVRALNLFLSLKKDSWTAAMAQLLEHSAYFELISRLVTNANSLNVRALNLFLSLKKTHGQQQ
jgi:hypothetical protein